MRGSKAQGARATRRAFLLSMLATAASAATGQVPRFGRSPGFRAGFSFLTPTPMMEISATAPAPAVYDVGYDDTRQISNGTPYPASAGQAPYTVAVTAGSMPTGLLASVDMDGKLRINGVPNGPAGTSNFTLTATDSVGATASLSTSITVPNLPSALTITFGAKTRVGFGGHRLGNAGGAALAITSGNAAGHWQIIDNRLVPKNAAGAYGSAPPSFAGPYTLVVTDGTSTQSLTINMAANAHHVAVGTATNPDGTGGAATHQLRTIMAGTILALGDTIYCRNGFFDPNSTAVRVRPAASYSGSGRITITSEWIDNSLDADGERNERHGARWGGLTVDAATSGDVLQPFNFQYLWWLNTQTSPLSLLRPATNDGYGYSSFHCRYETTNAAPANYAAVDGLTLNGAASTPVSADYNLFVNVGVGIKLKGTSTAGGAATGCTIRFNRFTGISSDAIDLGANTVAGTIVEDNFQAGAVDAGDSAHRDFIQHLGNTTGADIALGSFKRNVLYIGGAVTVQGLFFDDSTGTSRLTAGVIENNIIINSAVNAIAMTRFKNPSVRYNTVIVALANAGAVTPSITVPATKGGEDGTFTRNLTTAISITAQGGTVVSTPNVILSKTLSGYNAAFAAWSETSLSSRKKVIAAVVPLLNGAARNGDGTYSGALKPDGSWNDGA